MGSPLTADTHHHDHGLGASPSISQRTMTAAVAVTVVFVGVEAAAGWAGRSLALLSDAGHNLADAAALSLSWYALWIARRPCSAGMTFGYHRVAVVAALVNGLSLVGVALWIGWEAIGRLRSPEPVNSGLMIAVALIAIVVNVAIGVRMRDGSRHDLNVRSAYLHMMGDALSAVGVVVAGVVAAVTGSGIADPVVSLLIAAFILWSSYEVCRDSATVLLEGTPPGTDMSAVIAAIRAVLGVLDVHDLHVWMVGPGVVACSCHVVVSVQSIRQGQQIVRRVVGELEHRFHITYTTVQVEVDGCEPSHLHGVGRSPKKGHG